MAKDPEKRRASNRAYYARARAQLLERQRERYVAMSPEQRSVYLDKQRAKYQRDPDRPRQTRRANPQLYMWRAARERSKVKGLEFTITTADIVIPERCPVLSLKLEMTIGKASASSPALDRIDSSRGYTPDNIQVISHRANMLKNDGTPDEFRALSLFLDKRHAD